jgi:hypothetical protein
MAATFSVYKYCKTKLGWRYCKAAFHPNGKIKPNVVIVSGVEEKHAEGRYFLNFNGQWEANSLADLVKMAEKLHVTERSTMQTA